MAVSCDNRRDVINLTLEKITIVKQIIGPYMLLEELGKGGMGVVYRAQHRESGQIVALKTIFVPDEKRLLSLQREIRGLARVVHPGIVRIFEQGIEQGRPWYVMELLQGMTLEHYCREILWRKNKHGEDEKSTGPDSRESDDSQWWTRILGTTIDSGEWIEAAEQRSPALWSFDTNSMSQRKPAAGGRLQEVYTLVAKICRPLEYLHGFGIVHRDLKPSNILIKPDGTPVIMDFGLMYQFWDRTSRDQLENFHSSGGTLLYIPPEQITGDSVDARADLYSLGCILYELITGRVPFRAHSVSHAVQAHLTVPPIPASELVFGIPEKLDSLILKLLSKRPKNRIGYAEGVASIMIELGADAPRTDLFKPRSYLYRPDYTGRGGLIADLKIRFNRVQDGIGGLVLAGGESGIGKTRFLMETARLASRYKLKIFSGGCLPVDQPEGQATGALKAFQVFQGVVREIAEASQKAGPDTINRIFGPNQDLMYKYFGVLDPPEEPKGSVNGNINLEGVGRLQLYNALAQTLTAALNGRTGLFLLDDLQWADSLSIGFLEFLLRTGFFENTACLIICAFRTEEISSGLHRIANSNKVEYWQLGRLSREDISAIAGDMLALQQPPDALIQRLEDFSDGNPFFVAEYLRSVVDYGLLFRDDEGRWIIPSGDAGTDTEELIQVMPLPQSLHQLVERRLNSLSEPAGNLLEITAVTGREIDAMVLWSVVEFSSAVLDAMDELIQRQILEEMHPGSFRFVHDVFHQVCYNKIPVNKRIDLHHRTAEAFIAVHAGGNDEINPLIAYHWKQAGQAEKARLYFFKSARWALEHSSLDVAAKYFADYLDTAPDINSESIQMKLDYASKVLIHQGKTEQALAIHSETLKDAESLGDDDLVADSRIALAFTENIGGNYQHAKILVQKALERFKKTHKEIGVANALDLLGSILYREERYREARELFLEAYDIFDRLEKENGQAHILTNLGKIFYSEYQLDSAHEYYQRAIDIYSRTGMRHLEADNIQNQAMIHLVRRELYKARVLCETALNMIRKCGDRRREGAILANLAYVYSHQQQYDHAIKLYQRALSIHRDVGDIFFMAVTLFNLGEMEFHVARIHISERCYRESLEWFQKIRLPNYCCLPLTGLSVIERVAFGRLEQAETYLARAESMVENSEDNLDHLRVVCEQGHLLLAQQKSADDCLRTADAIIENIQGKEFDAEIYVAKLRAAIEHHQNGGHLFRGEIFSQMSVQLQKWVLVSRRTKK